MKKIISILIVVICSTILADGAEEGAPKTTPGVKTKPGIAIGKLNPPSSAVHIYDFGLDITQPIGAAEKASPAVAEVSPPYSGDTDDGRKRWIDMFVESKDKLHTAESRIAVLESGDRITTLVVLVCSIVTLLAPCLWVAQARRWHENGADEETKYWLFHGCAWSAFASAIAALGLPYVLPMTAAGIAIFFAVVSIIVVGPYSAWKTLGELIDPS